MNSVSWMLYSLSAILCSWVGKEGWGPGVEDTAGGYGQMGWDEVGEVVTVNLLSRTPE